MNERFASLLASRGVTRYQVSKATGVPQSSLSDFLNGKSTPKYENMRKLAAYFGVTAEYLQGLGESEAPAPVGDVKLALEQLEDLLSAETTLFDGACLTDEDKLKAYGGIQFLKAQLEARAKHDRHKADG